VLSARDSQGRKGGATVLDRIIARLNRVNRTSVFLATAAVVLVSLVLGGWWAAAVLSLVGCLVSGLIARSWNTTTVGGRIARLAILALVVTLAVQAIR
jgi:hypothetical protein